MQVQEIVGAAVDQIALVTRIAEIDDAIDAGQSVEWVNRARAEFLARHTRAQCWRELAGSPTLIVLDYRGKPVPVGNPPLAPHPRRTGAAK